MQVAARPRASQPPESCVGVQAIPAVQRSSGGTGGDGRSSPHLRTVVQGAAVQPGTWHGDYLQPKTPRFQGMPPLTGPQTDRATLVGLATLQAAGGGAPGVTPGVRLCVSSSTTCHRISKRPCKPLCQGRLTDTDIATPYHCTVMQDRILGAAEAVAEGSQEGCVGAVTTRQATPTLKVATRIAGLLVGCQVARLVAHTVEAGGRQKDPGGRFVGHQEADEDRQGEPLTLAGTCHRRSADQTEAGRPLEVPQALRHLAEAGATHTSTNPWGRALTRRVSATPGRSTGTSDALRAPSERT